MAKKNLAGHKPTPAKMNPSGYKGKSSGQTHVGKKGPSIIGRGQNTPPSLSGGKVSAGGGDANDGKSGPNIKQVKITNKPPKAK